MWKALRCASIRSDSFIEGNLKGLAPTYSSWTLWYKVRARFGEKKLGSFVSIVGQMVEVSLLATYFRATR